MSDQSLPMEQATSRILTIRGQRVILDSDLAELYGVTTKQLKQQVRRNRNKFPKDFFLTLTKDEMDELVTNCDRFKRLKHSGVLPFASTSRTTAGISASRTTACFAAGRRRSGTPAATSRSPKPCGASSRPRSRRGRWPFSSMSWRCAWPCATATPTSRTSACCTTRQPDKVRPAPVYDIVTTTTYLPADAMALTLEGSKRWPDEKRLLRFAEQRCGLSRSRARQSLERIADAVRETIPEIEAYVRLRPEFREVGLGMVAGWGLGLG